MQEQHQRAEQKLIEKAMKEDEFRQQLISNRNKKSCVWNENRTWSTNKQSLKTKDLLQ